MASSLTDRLTSRVAMQVRNGISGCAGSCQKRPAPGRRALRALPSESFIKLERRSGRGGEGGRGERNGPRLRAPHHAGLRPAGGRKGARSNTDPLPVHVSDEVRPCLHSALPHFSRPSRGPSPVPSSRVCLSALPAPDIRCHLSSGSHASPCPDPPVEPPPFCGRAVLRWEGGFSSQKTQPTPPTIETGSTPLDAALGATPRVELLSFDDVQRRIAKEITQESSGGEAPNTTTSVDGQTSREGSVWKAGGDWPGAELAAWRRARVEVHARADELLASSSRAPLLLIRGRPRSDEEDHLRKALRVHNSATRHD